MPEKEVVQPSITFKIVSKYTDFVTKQVNITLHKFDNNNNKIDEKSLQVDMSYDTLSESALATKIVQEQSDFAGGVVH